MFLGDPKDSKIVRAKQAKDSEIFLEQITVGIAAKLSAQYRLHRRRLLELLGKRGKLNKQDAEELKKLLRSSLAVVLLNHSKNISLKVKNMFLAEYRRKVPESRRTEFDEALFARLTQQHLDSVKNTAYIVTDTEIERNEKVVKRSRDELKDEVTPENVKKRVNRNYRVYHANNRAYTISATESLKEINAAGHYAATAQGYRKKRWNVIPDDRVRHSHKVMNGQIRKTGVTANNVGETLFDSGLGAQLAFPGDTSNGAPAEEVIRCRCSVRYLL